MSRYSSWGPSNELFVDPQVAAPGGNILSTFPLKKGAFAVLSGTSMATPYITGVVALYLSRKGATDPVALRDRLSTTANSLDWNDGTSTLVGLKAPISQQGSGIVNAVKLITATTEISPGTISLNVILLKSSLTIRIQHTSFRNTISP
jgi:subtilisin family serine protease